MALIDKIIHKTNLSETKVKVVRNLYWAVVGKVITLLGSLLVGIFVARYLGPEKYGLMSYIISYVTIFQVFASFGLDNIEIREESKLLQNRDKLVGTAFFLKLGFAIITMSLVIVTACVFETDAFTKTMIAVYSLSIILNAFSVIRNHFTALVWNEYIVKTEISRTLILAVVKVALLLLHADLVWFIGASLFDVAILASGYCVSYQKKIASISLWHFDKATAIYMLKEAFPLFLSYAAIVIYQKIDSIMIGNMLDKTSLGYYSVAQSFVAVVLFVPTILVQTITPILVRTKEQNRARYEEHAQICMNLTVWISIALGALLYLTSYWLIRYTYGAAYLLAVPILQILSFRMLGEALARTSGLMIIIDEKQKYIVFRNVAGCIVNLGLNFWLIPIWGIKGAAFVAAISVFTSGFLAHIIILDYQYLVKKELKAMFLGWKDCVNFKKIMKG